MEIQTDSVISNKDPEIFMINQFLFLKNKLVTSHGSFKNANHRDSGTAGQWTRRPSMLLSVQVQRLC